MFLDYFKEKNHKIVHSSPVIPFDDPTLLFANAGMNQFKSILKGEEKSDFSRATSSQKCIRVSGKHNDFEDVGYDGTHHTFFEMLGNWSFGDYYKKEAISFAWDLLTNVYKLDKSLLYATVYKDDDEAYELWNHETDIDKDHILRFGDKENFWEMGDVGPCGPCSEIHIDRGPGFCQHENDSNHKCGVNAEGGCGRFVELWNLVFIQYDRQEDKSLVPLDFKSVDTGMGLERIVSVLNQTSSNYTTDLFFPIIKQIEKDTHTTLEKETIAIQIIADHIRALTVAIADGGTPGNEGRSYVIRKILRRAVRYTKKLGIHKAYLYTLVNKVIDILGDVYPEIVQNKERVESIIKVEEEKFLETLDNGLKLINESIENIKQEKKTHLPGEIVFKLYDTYGFPVDITKEIAAEHNLTIDISEYNSLMQKQKERGKKNIKKTGVTTDLNSLDLSSFSKTEFLGYEKTEAKGKLIACFVNGQSETSIQSSQEAIFLFDKTTFYAESGGQEGDTGAVVCGDCEIKIQDVQKKNDYFLHFGTVKKGSVKQGDECFLKVDEKRRDAIRANHTATHLLQAALRKILGTHVGQAGSSVSADRLRFDFSHFHSLTDKEIYQIEEFVNRIIREAIPVETKILDKDEAIKQGAMAFFGEKYGDKVRVVSVGDESKELCGGTHLDNTGKAGLFLILSESSVASGVRRIEAITGEQAFLYVKKQQNELKNIATLLKVKEKFGERISHLIEENKKLEKEIKKLKTSSTQIDINEILKNKITKNNTDIVFTIVSNFDIEAQRQLSDKLKSKLGSGIVIIGNETGQKTLLTVAVTKDKSDFHAGKIVKALVQKVGGKGGGRPDFAQAGGKKISHLAQITEKFIENEI